MAEREGCILYHHRRPGKRVKKKESPLGCGVNLLHLGEGDYMWAAGPPGATRDATAAHNKKHRLRQLGVGCSLQVAKLKR
jgi:hypothetical protein